MDDRTIIACALAFLLVILWLGAALGVMFAEPLLRRRIWREMDLRYRTMLHEKNQQIDVLRAENDALSLRLYGPDGPRGVIEAEYAENAAQGSGAPGTRLLRGRTGL